MTRRTPFAVALAAALAATVLFLTLPVIAVFTDTSPGELLAALGGRSSLDALWLSLRASATALAIIVAIGTPAAWLLATRRFRGHSVAVTLIELPLVLPPAVAGIGLLAALGPQGLLGPALADAGVELALTRAGLVVALVFVAAPFYIRAAQAGFEAVERSQLEAARTLGAGEARTLARVAVPAALPALASGAALAWGRAIGEFGATLMFAGSFAGVTRTAPLEIFDRFASDFTGALALSAVLIAVSAAILLTVKALTRVPGAIGGRARA